MGFVSEYAEHIAGFLAFLSNPNSSIPLITLLQAAAAVVGAGISVLGFVKAWRYAESRLGQRLTDFLATEEAKLAAARDAVKEVRRERGAVKHSQVTLFSNHELRSALTHLRRRRFGRAEHLLNDALLRTKEREDLALEKTSLHKKQRAMAHLLLGAIADSKSEHQSALTHFQTAFDIDNGDVEALEYIGLQLLRVGNAAQALVEFTKLRDIASAQGDGLLIAHANRNIGLAYESLPVPSAFNANVAYKDSIAVFPANGPVMEIAYIHELRGKANIALRNWQLANTSFMQALQRYSQVMLADSREKADAATGAKRVQNYLRTVSELQNASVASTVTTQAGVPVRLSLTRSGVKSEEPAGLGQ